MISYQRGLDLTIPTHLKIQDQFELNGNSNILGSELEERDCTVHISIILILSAHEPLRVLAFCFSFLHKGLVTNYGEGVLQNGSGGM